ncbi:hypothetical protein ACGFI9_36980 [Micromonospora sp. NPDC048930]|uniref:hypothetical protein n=1 Tax=Micromonospora sp. NPDC048930 TaxID=3364261 RepID=UPI00371E875F
MSRHLPVAAALLAAAFVTASCTGDPGTPSTAAPTTPDPPTTSAPTQAPPAHTNPPSGRATPRPSATSGPASPAPPRAPLVTAPASGPTTATGLRSRTRCGPAGSLIAIADLTWRPAATRGAQRVVYTPYADGYRTGRYEVTPDLRADATGTSVSQLSPGSVYTWLVLTRHDGRWQPSATASFAVPTCVGDQTGG